MNLKDSGVKFRDPCDDYEILECIGEGGFGQIYKARHYQTGHLAAIKIIDCQPRNYMDSLDRRRRSFCSTSS
uniref:Protein kinase domain-containing protein n=1 Tax=Denticeps clupeoides TaxID=299321 RepID=A0AAY4A6J5_9TELE